jgi:hypothetical protein
VGSAIGGIRRGLAGYRAGRGVFGTSHGGGAGTTQPVIYIVLLVAADMYGIGAAVHPELDTLDLYYTYKNPYQQ